MKGSLIIGHVENLVW